MSVGIAEMGFTPQPWLVNRRLIEFDTLCNEGLIALVEVIAFKIDRDARARVGLVVVVERQRSVAFRTTQPRITGNGIHNQNESKSPVKLG